MTEEIVLKYHIGEGKESIQILGNDFVDNYMDTLKIKVDNNIENITDYYYIKDKSDKKELEIKLLGINEITDFNNMFSDCKSLISISDNISKLDTSNVTDMSNMFFMCKGLKTLPVYLSGILRALNI